MRRSIRAIVVRLRERKRLYEELNLNQLDRQMTAACNAILGAEEAIDELDQLPNVVAARLLASLSKIVTELPAPQETVTAGPWQWGSLPCGAYCRACPGGYATTRRSLSAIQRCHCPPCPLRRFEGVTSDKRPSRKPIIPASLCWRGFRDAVSAGRS